MMSKRDLYFMFSGSGAVGLAHLDGSYTEECIISMVHKVQHLSLGVQGRLELHLIGGFSDERHQSEELFFAIMRKYWNLSHVLIFLREI